MQDSTSYSTVSVTLALSLSLHLVSVILALNLTRFNFMNVYSVPDLCGRRLICPQTVCISQI
jgi:hypothetical protein